MSDLRDLFADLGFPGARTLLQSGNAVFTGSGRTGAELERLLEAETEKRLGSRTDYFVRTADEWRRIVERNPFPAEAKKDPGRLVALILKKAPNEDQVKALRSAVEGPEIVRASGRHAYITYPEGQGRSKLTLTRIEDKLGSRGTCRNWNTILKLSALAGGVRA